MTKQSLDRGIWSAALIVCGFALARDFDLRGYPNVIGMAVTFVVWIRVQSGE